MKTRLLLAVLLLTMALLAAGPAAGAPVPESAALPIEEWTGKVFAVLPLEGGKKAEGYPFTLNEPHPRLMTEKNIRADWLEGKKLVVTTVRKIAAVSQDPRICDYEVTFRETDSGVILTAPALGGQVAQLVPADDLAAAQKYFAGKVVFSKRQSIPAFQQGPGTVGVRVDEPLAVADVIYGITADEPIWLVVTTLDNKKGYIAIAYSLTNVQRGFWAENGRPWEAVLFEQNPRTLYAWDDSVWATINAGEVKTGMAPDQVRLAWGRPHRIELTGGEEVWFYPAKMVKFHPTAGVYLVQER